MRTPIPLIQSKDFEGVSAEGLRLLDLVRRSTLDIRLVNFTFDPASIAANTTVEQTTTITGLKVDDIVLRVIKPSHTAGVAVNDGRVTAIDTLGIVFLNVTGGAINPSSEDYTVIYIKNSRA
jgi:hypothetical protein